MGKALIPLVKTEGLTFMAGPEVLLGLMRLKAVLNNPDTYNLVMQVIYAVAIRNSFIRDETFRGNPIITQEDLTIVADMLEAVNGPTIH